MFAKTLPIFFIDILEFFVKRQACLKAISSVYLSKIDLIASFKHFLPGSGTLSEVL